MDLRFDPVEACEFHWAEMALHAAATNAAFLLHEDGATTEEAEDYLREWAFESNEKAARSVAFMTEPSSPRTCPPMPTAEPLCWNFAERSPRNFTRLLTEQLTSAELLS